MSTSEPVTQKHSWRRVDGIDLLRGLAIFFVLMNHVNMRLLGERIHYLRFLPDQLAASLVWNGQAGVQIFFAVSGFLITSTSLRRWNPLSTTSIADFYRLRFARIAPLLLALLAALSVLHLAGIHHFVVSASTGGLGRALLAALTFHINVLEAHRGYLPANWDILWSLSVEEAFYLFFPLLCRSMGRGKLLILLLFAFVVLGPLGRTLFTHGNEVWREYSYLGGMDAIAMGCLTAFFNAWRRLSPKLLAITAGLGAAILIFALCFSLETYRLGLSRVGLTTTLLGFGTCLVILASSQSGWRSPCILIPVLKLGQRSYEVYLTHMFVVFALFDLYVKAGKSLHMIPVLFIAAILVAGFMGEIVARFYSEPMNRMLRQRWGDGADRLGSVASEQANPSPSSA